MSRQRLPITQRHRKDCTRRRDCGCPWRPRVRDAAGKFRGRTWDTYAEAEQEYYELRAARPEPLADRATTVAQWAQRWLATGDWRPTTRRLYGYSVKNHIEPALGHYLMTELRRDDVDLWVARMRAAGAGWRGAAADLHVMYKSWQDAGKYLPYGIPMRPGLIKPPPRKEFDSLTDAQVAAWAAAVPPDVKLMVEVEDFYGLRMGEVRALREEDVLFTGKDVMAPLGPQLARLAALPPGKYEARKPRMHFQRKLGLGRAPEPIKNERRGNRFLPLPQWIAGALAVHLEKWPPADGWLFVNRRGPGGYMSARPERWGHNSYLGWLLRAAKAAGIVLPPKQCSHALRHHCVSVLRAKGWSDHDIGYWIGDSPLTVAAVYGRPMPDAMDRIAGMLSEGRDAAEAPLRAVD